MTNISDESKHIITAVKTLYYGKKVIPNLDVLLKLAETDPEWVQDTPSARYTVEALHQAENDGRIAALRGLYQEFLKVAEELDRWHFLLIVETTEVELLCDTQRRRTAIVRGCSFLDQYFRYRLGEDPDDHRVSLGQLINDSLREGVLEKPERKIAHFIREVRNDAAHYGWLDPKFDDRILHIATEALLYLIGNMMIREFKLTDSHSLGEDPAAELDPHDLISDMEEVSGWVYDEGTYKWYIPE